MIKPSATSGTFYVADAKGDRVVSFHASGLDMNDYYGSVGGAQNAFGQIDPKTGLFTALVSNANDKGFGSPHGVTFVADSRHLVGTAPGFSGHQIEEAAKDVTGIIGHATDALPFNSAGIGMPVLDKWRTDHLTHLV